MSINVIFSIEFSRNSICPDEKLSKTTTSSSLLTRRSTRCEPMNPAPPVTKIELFLNYNPVQKNNSIELEFEYINKSKEESIALFDTTHETSFLFFRKGLITNKNLFAKLLNDSTWYEHNKLEECQKSNSFKY